MANFNLKLKPEAVLAVMSIAVKVADLILSNKKDDSSRAKLKAEILEEIREDLSQNK